MTVARIKRTAPAVVRAKSLGTGMRPWINAASGDWHSNSTLGLCPSRGVRLDDGGTYTPGKLGVWIWQQWLDYWGVVADMRKREGAALAVTVNGEFTDGDHHNTSQIITRNPADMFAMAIACAEPILALAPDAVIVTRGTEAHSGKAGSFDESMARFMKASGDDETGAASHWVAACTFSGVNFHTTHHGRSGSRPWTFGGQVNNEAAELVYIYAYDDWKPHVAIRNHHHIFRDSGRVNHRVRVMGSGAWQLKTSFAQKVAANGKAEIGGLIYLCRNGQYEDTVFRRGADKPTKPLVFV